MAYVVEIIGNICYAQGKYLRFGEQYDTGDTTLDKQILDVIEEQLSAGRTIRVLREYDVEAVKDENVAETGAQAQETTEDVAPKATLKRRKTVA